jgi:hypothetical protein
LVLESYLPLPLDIRHQKIVIENHKIDESVLAILGEVDVPEYERPEAQLILDMLQRIECKFDYTRLNRADEKLWSVSTAHRLEPWARCLWNLGPHEGRRVSRFCIAAPTHFVVRVGCRVLPNLPIVQAETAPPTVWPLANCAPNSVGLGRPPVRLQTAARTPQHLVSCSWRSTWRRRVN